MAEPKFEGFPAPLELPKDTKENPTAPPKDKPPRQRPASTGGRQAPLQKRTQELIGTFGFMIGTVNEIDGLAIIEGAERLSFALENAAKQSPAFRRTLEAVLTGSVWGEVVFASGAILLPIALNHGMVPASLGAGLLSNTEASRGNGDGPQT